MVTLRSEKQNAEECINVLRFAQRAKSVQATVVKVSEKRNAVGNKKMQEELEAANSALADYQSKLSSAEQYKASLMAEVQTLLKEMKTLQKESEASKAKLAQMQASGESRKTNSQYVEALEQRVHDLEEENRILKQRDIMHRVGYLQSGAEAEGGGPKLSGDFKPGGMETFVPRGTRISQVDYFSVSTASMTPKQRAQSKWTALRAAVLGPKRAKQLKQVHPAGPTVKRNRALNYKPKVRKYSKKDAAAIKIQKVWRGKMDRDELAMGYGYDEFDDYYDDYYEDY